MASEDIQTYLGLGTHAARLTAPDLPVGTTAVYFETDTQDIVVWNGAGWTGTGGAAGGVFEPSAIVTGVDIDVSTAAFFALTVSGATALTVSGVPSAPIAASFILEVTNGGAFPLTWWAGLHWAGGTAPALSAAGLDVLGFYTMGGAGAWRGLLLAKAVA